MRHRVALAVLLALFAAGCGTQEVLLGTKGMYVFTVRDQLARPGERVPVEAQLQGGDLIMPLEGRLVYFESGGYRRAALTDGAGVATAHFEPEAAGDVRIRASVSPAGLPEAPPDPQTLVVASRTADEPLAIVDLDKTVVATGFHTVLVGAPDPMAGSVDVIERLAADHTIVYLTHRPGTFGPKSKAWLWSNGYPRGPVLLATIGGFLSGSGTYKTGRLRELTERFENIEYGIGDKISDAAAYQRNGIQAYLIVQFPEADKPEPYDKLADRLVTLPDAVQVVTGWRQIERGIFGDASFPRSAMEERLRDKADRLRRKAARARRRRAMEEYQKEGQP